MTFFTAAEHRQWSSPYLEADWLYASPVPLEWLRAVSRAFSSRIPWKQLGRRKSFAGNLEKKKFVLSFSPFLRTRKKLHPENIWGIAWVNCLQVNRKDWPSVLRFWGLQNLKYPYEVLWTVKFTKYFILCGVIFLVRLWRKFEFDHFGVEGFHALSSFIWVNYEKPSSSYCVM